MIFEDRMPEHVSPRTKLIAGAVLALALALAIAAWFFGWFSSSSDTAAAPSGPPPANVSIDFAQTMVMSPHTVLPGTVVSVRDAVIASETSGKVLSVAFVGDVLFKGSIGRTDFPRGDHQTLVDSIKQQLWPLGNEVVFVPGHGPTSTFGEERQTNPFVAD